MYLDELAPEAASGELVSATANHTMSWAPRADQAAAIAGAVTQDGHIGATCNLVSPEPYTYDEVAALLSEATGKHVIHRTAAATKVIPALIDGGMNPEHAESMVRDFHAAIATGKCHTTSSDTARLCEHTGRPTADYLAALAKRTALAH